MILSIYIYMFAFLLHHYLLTAAPFHKSSDLSVFPTTISSQPLHSTNPLTYLSSPPLSPHSRSIPQTSDLSVFSTTISSQPLHSTNPINDLSVTLTYDWSLNVDGTDTRDIVSGGSEANSEDTVCGRQLRPYLNHYWTCRYDVHIQSMNHYWTCRYDIHIQSMNHYWTCRYDVHVQSMNHYWTCRYDVHVQSMNHSHHECVYQ